MDVRDAVDSFSKSQNRSSRQEGRQNGDVSIFTTEAEHSLQGILLRARS